MVTITTIRNTFASNVIITIATTTIIAADATTTITTVSTN